ncbi:MAG: hypothetical protein H6555_07120 [Lewinellaceae bacterium]|nr:hypothetical protein [Lewinellaceae bacterium]
MKHNKQVDPAILNALFTLWEVGAQLDYQQRYRLKTALLTAATPGELSEAIAFFNEPAAAMFLDIHPGLAADHDLAVRRKLPAARKPHYLAAFQLIIASIDGEGWPAFPENLLHDLLVVGAYTPAHSAIAPELARKLALECLPIIAGLPLHRHNAPGRAVSSWLDGIAEIANTVDCARCLPAWVAMLAQMLDSLEAFPAALLHDIYWQRYVQHCLAALSQTIQKAPADTNLDQQVAMLFTQLLKATIEAPRLTTLASATLQPILKSITQQWCAIPASPLQLAGSLEQEHLVRLTLETLADAPALVVPKDGLQEICTSLSEMLLRPQINHPEMLPGLLRLVFEWGAENLALLQTPPGTPRGFLLIQALRESLLQLLGSPGGQSWFGKLNYTQRYQLLDQILEAVTHHPALVSDQVGQQSVLLTTLDAVLRGLSKLPPDHYPHPELLTTILESCLRTVTLSPSVLDVIDWDEEQETDAALTTILHQVLTLIFSSVFDPATERTGTEEMALLRDLLSFSLDEILLQYPNQLGLVLIKIILSPETGFDFREGFDRQWAEQLLEAALALMSQHPHLILDEEGWQEIITGATAALLTSGLHQPALLPELIRLVMEKTAGQLTLLVETEDGEVEYLLVLALREILTSLASPTPGGTWRPELTPEQLLRMVEFLLDEVVHNPNWLTTSITNHPLLREVLQIHLRALGRIPREQRIGFQTLEELLSRVLQAVVNSHHLLDKVNWGAHYSERSILEHALNLVIGWVFPPGEGAGLNKPQQLTDLLTYVLDVLLAENPNPTGLALLELILSDAVGIDLSSGFEGDMVEDLVDAALMAVATQPELLSDSPGMREIVNESAAAIHLLGIDHPEIGLDILRMVFEESAGRLNVLLEVQDNHFRHLLVEALQQLATALSTERRQGRWSQRLSEDQILELVHFVFQGVVEHPEWVEEEFLYHTVDAILTAVDFRNGNRRIPYLLVFLLIQDLLTIANERREFLLPITVGDKREVIAISYIVERLMGILLAQDLRAWRKITQEEVLETVIHYYLQLMDQWDLSIASIEAAVEQLQRAARQLAAGSMNLDEFLDLLGGGD